MLVFIRKNKFVSPQYTPKNSNGVKTQVFKNMVSVYD